MSKKRKLQRALDREQAKRDEAPRLIQQISFSGTYNVANDCIDSFSSAPADLNPLALLHALHTLEMQVVAAVMKRQQGETPPTRNEA
jgi:hypothetical protein